ncbi:Monocarboxylate transporter 9 [Papilio machaon]|uniref:Monocarboxylate transporter 9 n=1 Tax=Papilio machaon TaxID=76193 RepID=A0A194R4D4_PAPMA|nr:Monocarboxylate transporter 9 [Papilio machaon]
MAKSKKEIRSKVMKEGEFIPPDGGWGWMIVLAAGFSNLFALPMLQQFGLLFRDKFARLGISSSETTTIINMNSALTSCVGLANGPVFKTFSYRQVSLTGAVVVFISLLLTTFSYNFMTYLLSFSILYGVGYGISSSANALALNTYWKKRRRLATGLSWTTTGMGPMLWPHIITGLFALFGETGAIFIISGLSLHAIACALLLQPVEWHSKSPKEIDEEKLLTPDLLNDHKMPEESGYFSQVSKIKNLSVFSSQYLYNEDDPVTPGYEITDPGIPMMLRANDGYFSQSRQSKSRMSSRDGSNRNSRLNSKKPSMSNLLENRSRKSSTLYLNESKKNSSANLGALVQEREGYKPKRKTSITLDTQIPESEIEDCPTLKAPQDLKAEEKAAVENIDPKEAKFIADRAEKHFAGSKSIKSFKMDGQYGEKYNKDNHSNVSFKNQEENDEKKYLKDNHSNQSNRTRNRRKSNNFNYESEVLKQASLKLEQYLKESEDKSQSDKFKLLINSPVEDDVFDEKKEKIKEHEDVEEELTFCQKVAIFFDLDLLQDFTFINLMLGITLANFNELNFSILTPFILGDYGMTKPQVAFFMSLLAGVDLCVRFCIPFIAGKIGWDNNSFFLFGVLSMALGRVVLSFCQTYSVVLLVAVMIGFGKGFRTVFMALVIPTHVPLHKLPGATGIQLLTAGIVYLALGPVVGWIKDNTTTAVTLHCLNIFTWLTAFSWGLEKYIAMKRQKNAKEDVTKT